MALVLKDPAADPEAAHQGKKACPQALSPVGATAGRPLFLHPKRLGVILFGVLALAVGTAGGVRLGKRMGRTSGGKMNLRIGWAGASAWLMAAGVLPAMPG